jgi:hypothetical protein
MTGRRLGTLASAGLALALGACTSFYEITIETPIQPKLDVSPFRRVLVAGFLAGGTDEVDANLETVRLLRSQLRTRSDLTVIEADVLNLAEVAARSGARPAAEGEPVEGEPRIRNQRDLEAYEHIFADTAFWKKLGEEYQEPLIVTGTILFLPHTRSGMVERTQEVIDAFGRRRVVPVRTYLERKGFILSPKFIFIDGRSGATLYSESFREEILYSAQQATPALSSYFELMDRLIPSFLSTLSTQKVRGTRVLLK